MLQRDPGGEHVALTAYERRQLELIEQTLEQEDPRSPGGERSDKRGAESYPTWMVLEMTWVWFALMSLAAGSVLLVLLATAGGAAFLAHTHRQRRRAEAMPDETGA